MVPTVNVSVNVFDQNGAPLAGAEVVAELVGLDTYTNQLVGPIKQIVLTDADGLAVVPLFPNALGERNSFYRFRVTNLATGRKLLETTAAVPNADCNLTTIAGNLAQLYLAEKPFLVQPYSDRLTSFASLVGAANTVPYFTGPNSFGTTNAPAFRVLSLSGFTQNVEIAPVGLGPGLPATTTLNVAIGPNAMAGKLSGSGNVAIGWDAYRAGVGGAGSDNTALGQDALYHSTGDKNTGVGYTAGFFFGADMTGSNNTFVGANAKPAAAGDSNKITLGDALITHLRCQVQTITALSDRRDKKDIKDLPIGLDFITRLRPVRFTWAMRDGAKEGIQEAGFIAQDLDEVQRDFGAEEYLDLVMHSNPEKLEASPGKLLPVLVKAIQELAEQNREYESRIRRLEKGR